MRVSDRGERGCEGINGDRWGEMGREWERWGESGREWGEMGRDGERWERVGRDRERWEEVERLDTNHCSGGAYNLIIVCPFHCTINTSNLYYVTCVTKSSSV